MAAAFAGASFFSAAAVKTARADRETFLLGGGTESQKFAVRRTAPARRHEPTRSGHVAVRSHAEAPVDVDRATCPHVKAEVDLASFEAIDIRVGLVTDAKSILDKEMSEKRGKPTPSRKFLQLEVDIGCEVRTVISECRFLMDVEDAVGKKVLFVANLPKTEIEGIESHGVILAGLNYDPTPMPRSFKLILPGLGRLPPGSQVLTAAIPR